MPKKYDKTIDDNEVLSHWYGDRETFVVDFDISRVEVDLEDLRDGKVEFYLKGSKKIPEKHDINLGEAFRSFIHKWNMPLKKIDSIQCYTKDDGETFVFHAEGKKK